MESTEAICYVCADTVPAVTVHLREINAPSAMLATGFLPGYFLLGPFLGPFSDIA